MKYAVHTYQERDVPVPATLQDGSRATAMVRGFEVELVPEAEHLKTMTWVQTCQTQEEVDAARELFAAGGSVDVTLSFQKVAEGEA